jgi:hypothetical protein
MKTPKIRVHLFLDAKVLEQAQVLADARGQNLSEYIRAVLADAAVAAAKG